MQLRLSQLRRVAEHATELERTDEALRRELKRAFGPSFVIEGRLAAIARAANERLDELEGSGGAARVGIKTSSLIRISDHPSADVRRLAVRLLPERFIRKFSCDHAIAVRHAAAARLPPAVLVEMARADPTDSVVRGLIRQHRREQLLAETQADPGSSEIDQEAELSDEYYTSLAERLMQDYGRRFEFGWEQAAVRQLVRSTKATSGIVLDEERLLSALDEIRDERDDAALEMPDRPLREVSSRPMNVRRGSQREQRSAIPLIGDHETDPVRILEAAGAGSQTFMRDVERLFKIRGSLAPAAVQRHLLREGISRRVVLPSSGRLPCSSAPRAADERVLDAYAKKWNERAAGRGDLVRIAWSPAASHGEIGFTSEVV